MDPGANPTTPDSLTTRRQFLLGAAVRLPELRKASSWNELPERTRNLFEEPLTSADMEVLNSFSDEEVKEAEERIYAQFSHIRQYGM